MLGPAPPEARAAQEYPLQFQREVRAAERHGLALAAKHPKLPRFIRRELEAIGRMAGDDRDRLEAMYRLADNVAKKLAPVAACRPGCGSCCHIAVQMPGIEAAALGQKLGITPAPRRPPTLGEYVQLQRDEVANQWFGVPCPFLDGQNCGIYSARPLACRLHFNMGETAFFCGTHITPEHSFVPNYNLNDFWMACSGFFWWTGVADIREWFPGGVKR